MSEQRINNTVTIHKNGNLYIPYSVRFVTKKFYLMWDKETGRIGIKPDKNGPRTFTSNGKERGLVASISSLLKDHKIPRLQKCEAEWDGDIYAIKVIYG